MFVIIKFFFLCFGGGVLSIDVVNFLPIGSF